MNNILIFDDFIDTPGTVATAHSPEAGGPIVSAAANSAAVITSANRMRGDFATGFSFFSYSATPPTPFYTIDFTFYCASNANGFGITARQPAGSATGGTGIFLDYAAGAGRWTIAGPGINGDSAFQALTPGQRYKGQMVLAAGTITVTIDRTQIFSKPVTGTPIAGLAGFAFNGQDSDTTGIHLESFTAYAAAAAATPSAPVQISAMTGSILYAVLIAQDGTWFNWQTLAWETLNTANWANYVIPLTEVVANTGAFFGSIGSGLPAGTVLLSIYSQAATGGGGTPASTDPQYLDGSTALVYVLDWTGTAIKSIAPLAGGNRPQMQVPARQNSLVFAQQMLDLYLDAEATLATTGVASVTVDGEQTVFRNFSEMHQRVLYWRNQVNLLSGRRRRASTLRLDNF